MPYMPTRAVDALISVEPMATQSRHTDSLANRKLFSVGDLMSAGALLVYVVGTDGHSELPNCGWLRYRHSLVPLIQTAVSSSLERFGVHPLSPSCVDHAAGRIPRRSSG